MLTARARGHPGGHLDGLGRGVGRLLGLDRRRRHLRRALDDHRLDRRVRHLAELPGHAAEARHRRRRGRRRRRSPASPICCAARRPEASQSAPDGGRRHLSPLHHARRRCAPSAAGAGQRDRPGPGVGRRHRAPARPGRPVRQAGATRSPRRRAAPISIRRDVQPVYLEKQPGWLARLFADAARDDDDDRGDASVAPRDAFAAHRPPARRRCSSGRSTTRSELLAGPAIQARCLECGAETPVAAGAEPSEFAVGAAARTGLAGVRIRRATADDAAAIASIYAPYVLGQRRLVRDGGAGRGGDARRRIEALGDLYPWLVACDEDGAVLGYAYALRLPDPPGLSLHGRDHGLCRRGRARARHRRPRSTGACCRCWRRRVSPRRSARSPCPIRRASRLHELLGFARAGTYEKVGFKLGEWRSVGLWQRPLAPMAARPEEPKPLSAVWKAERA